MKTRLYRCLVLLLAVSLLAGCGVKDPADKDAATTTSSSAIVTTTASTSATTNLTTTDTTGTTATTQSTKRTVSTRSRGEETTTTTVATLVNTGIYPIKQTMSVEQSSLRIHNNVTPTQKVKSVYARVTQYDPEWAFMHHPAGVVYFKGKLYTAFSRGYWGEDFPGQQMAISSSTNFYDWSEPTVIAASTQGKYGETCVIPWGFYVLSGKLIANFCICDYDAAFFDEDGDFIPTAAGKRTDTLYQIYTEDGVNWSEPKVISSINTLSGVRQVSTGRWVSCSGKWIHYTDDAVPNGLKKWNWYVMTPEQQANSHARNGGKPLTEGSWYEGPDGIIHSMIRSDSGYMFHAESYDGGKTLTEFYPTRFSSDNSQFNFFNLRDGRALGIGSPNSSEDIWDLWPLNIYISEDGYNFDTAYILRDEKYTLRQQGHSKGGEYGYMKMLEHDGYLYVFYSRKKEVMEISRVAISDLVS